ncbi:membrane protein insertion efficiency factor YidD [Candidatus Gracilibacteria bacterium]|nr:membrane protein insertion efficiency factor YidD [Candidatus Gracilibacteria bacterium]NJS42108.1 membrane protein insertion efficiency factor YidD [Candidatus Gracilibacteria bacterium]
MGSSNVLSLPKIFGIYCIRVYQVYLSKYTGSCRHYPSCSSYTLRSINNFGLLKGSYKGYQRLRRCSSKKTRGYDPVAKQFHWSYESPLNQACIYQTTNTFDTSNFRKVITHRADLGCCDADCDVCCCDGDCC